MNFHKKMVYEWNSQLTQVNIKRWRHPRYDAYRSFAPHAQ